MDAVVISDTIQEFNGIRYYLCGSYFQNDGRRLHRAVWAYHNGPIPKNFHVHHKDENRANNSLNNLELVLGSIHLSRHAKADSRKEYNAQHIKDIRELASEWHRSPAGRKWHSAHAKAMKRTDHEYVCTECGSAFITTHRYGKSQNTFCSDTCKAKYRRKSGVDNETRICVYCGGSFVVDKYSKTRCCSRECAVKNRWYD